MINKYFTKKDAIDLAVYTAFAAMTTAFMYNVIAYQTGAVFTSSAYHPVYSSIITFFLGGVFTIAKAIDKNIEINNLIEAEVRIYIKPSEEIK